MKQLRTNDCNLKLATSVFFIILKWKDSQTCRTLRASFTSADKMYVCCCVLLTVAFILADVWNHCSIKLCYCLLYEQLHGIKLCGPPTPPKIGLMCGGQWWYCGGPLLRSHKQQTEKSKDYKEMSVFTTFYFFYWLNAGCNAYFWFGVTCSWCKHVLTRSNSTWNSVCVAR